MTRLRRRLRPTIDTTSFCDSCGQVCTAECRSAALRDRARAQVLLTIPIH
jgi:hypothetical protein